MKIDKTQFIVIKIVAVVLVVLFNLGFMFGLYNTVDDQITRLDNPTVEQIKQLQEMIQHFDSAFIILPVFIIVVILGFPYPKNKPDESNDKKDTVGT